MQAWYHCENTYPFVPQEVLDRADSVRGSLPNKYCDPKTAADLFHECLDEHLLCDDMGVKTLTSDEGPFSWEGKHFTHRHVNIWPPCHQRLHPPPWEAADDPATSRELGRRGMEGALFATEVLPLLNEAAITVAA